MLNGLNIEQNNLRLDFVLLNIQEICWLIAWGFSVYVNSWKIRVCVFCLFTEGDLKIFQTLLGGEVKRSTTLSSPLSSYEVTTRRARDAFSCKMEDRNWCFWRVQQADLGSFDIRLKFEYWNWFWQPRCVLIVSWLEVLWHTTCTCHIVRALLMTCQASFSDWSS